jgi:hypothetical protein
MQRAWSASSRTLTSAGGSIGPEVLGEALFGEVDHAVGGGEDGLRRAIVAVQRDDVRRWREFPGEVEDVAHARSAERVDRLGIVTDHSKPVAPRLERQQDRCLQAVGVLIFVDQDMVEAAANVAGQGGIAHGLRPIQQEIVVIEHGLALLGFDIGREQPFELCRPARAPGECQSKHLLNRAFRVDTARVDRKTRALCREAVFRFRKSHFVSDQVHQVGGIFPVVDRKAGIEADLVGVFPQHASADAMKGAGPAERVGHRAGIVADHLAGDPLYALCHLGRRAARKCHQQDAPGIGAVHHQMRHAMGQRVGLAGTRAGYHQKRRKRARSRRAMLDGPSLLRIEAVKVSGCRWHGMVVPTVRDHIP